MGVKWFINQHSHHVNLGWVETNPPLVFWYQWDYLRSPAKNLFLFAGYLRLAMVRHETWRYPLVI